MSWKIGQPTVSRMIGGMLMIATLSNGFAPTSLAACPTFNDFAASPVRSKVSVPPDVPTEIVEEKGYRQVLDDAKKPANFAGHYRISVDTCGTSMIVVMIADLNTGKVQELGCLSWFYDGDHPQLPTGLRHRVNSRLLVAYGCISSGRPCGAHFYKIENDELHLVCSAPFKGNLIDTDFPSYDRNLPNVIESPRKSRAYDRRDPLKP